MRIAGISGTAKLVEVYEKPTNKRYYARCKLEISSSEKSKDRDVYPSNNVEVEIKITQEQYEKLKADMEGSNSKWPLLVILGNLEAKVQGSLF